MHPQCIRIYGTADAGAQTLDSSTNAILRSKFSLKSAPMASLHYEWTKTGATGATTVLTLWASNKPEASDDDDDDWVDISSTVTLTGPADNTGKRIVNLVDVGAAWYMLKLVTASGTSTLSAWVHGKASSR